MTEFVNHSLGCSCLLFPKFCQEKCPGQTEMLAALSPLHSYKEETTELPQPLQHLTEPSGHFLEVSQSHQSYGETWSCLWEVEVWLLTCPPAFCHCWSARSPARRAPKNSLVSCWWCEVLLICATLELAAPWHTVNLEWALLSKGNLTGQLQSDGMT